MLAVDLGGTTIKIGVVTDGRVIAADALPNRGVPDDLDAALDRGVALLAAASTGSDGLGGVGVALPGVVDGGRLVGAHDKYSWAHGVDLAGRITDRLGPRPVVVANDARAALVGEAASGCAVGVADAVMIILGTGIGTAVMIDGRVLDGRGGHRGILGGHLTITDESIACNCGNTGCAEAVGGSWNLARQARGLSGWATSSLAAAVGAGRLDMAELFRAREEADPVARALSDRVLRAWQSVAVDLCHAYTPELLIFSGGSVRAAGRWLDETTRPIGDRLWSTLPRPEIRVADDPAASVLLGLAALVDR